MGNNTDDSGSEYETDSGSEYETEDEVVVSPPAKPATIKATPVSTPAKRKSNKPAPKVQKSNPNREAVPCKNYRVNTTAESFGECRCGWPRADHVEKGTNKAALALSRLKSSKLDSPVNPSGNGPCLNFRVDVTATKFGMCRCGYAQADHAAKKDNPAERALRSLHKSVKDINVPQKGDTPCHNFVLDMNATTFNTCLCGHAKSKHVEKNEDPAAMMLRNLKEKNAAANERADMLAAGIDPDASKKGEKKTAIKDQSSAAKPKPKSCCVVQ